MSKEKFLDIVNTHIKRKGINDLVKWLHDNNFWLQPASSRFHCDYEGGLSDHSINTYNNLIKLNSVYNITDNQETLAIIALFHDLCKVNFYKSVFKNEKIYKPNGTKSDAGGRFDWESVRGYVVDEKFPYGYHGPKSVYLIGQFMQLTDEEAVCIANHMGAYDRVPTDMSLSSVFEKYPLALLLHTADNLATVIDEKKGN